MKQYPNAKIGDICRFVNGGTPSRKVEEYFTGNIPWITGADVEDLKIKNIRSFITKEAIENSSTNVVPKGTVLLVTRTGVGKVAIADRDLCFSQDLTGIFPDQQKLISEYLGRFLMYSGNYLKSLQRGATIQGISRNVLAGLKIPVPPLSVQRKIAAILEKVDQARRKRQEALRLSDQFLQSTFLQMFGDPVKNPKGWKANKLGNSIKLKSGEFLPSKDMNIDGLHAVYGGNGINGYHTSYLFQEPKIVIGRVGMNCGNVVITKPKSWITDNALYVSNKIEIFDDIFLAHMLRQLKLNRFANKAAQPLITGQLLNSLNVYIPPLKIQKIFSGLIEIYEFFLGKQYQSSKDLESLFQSLTQKSFKGELVF